MIKVTKRKMGKMNITIKEHFPDDPKDMNKIRDIITEVHLNEMRKLYSEEMLNILIPVSQRVLDLEELGYSSKDSEAQAIREYQEGKIKAIV